MSYHRISKYMPGVDGTKLAIDLYLPDTEEKVPLLQMAGYGPRREQFQFHQQAIERFLEAGYAVSIVEVRGSGASYGISDGFFGLHDGKDLACILDALSREDWCNGKTGTFGGSNYGMSQDVTLIEQPESLYASIPCDNSMDFYDQDFPNGVSALPNMPADHHEVPIGVPVDEDPAPDYPMAHEAQKIHARNLPFLAQHIPNMYRDDVHPYLGYRPNLDVPSWEKMDTVRFGHTAVWNCGAWFDPGCTNKILTWKSWGGKLIIGPWPHVGIYRGADTEAFPNGGYDWVTDHLRWFDAHLKGRDNGITQEPPVMYYCIGDEGNEWHRDADFPVAGTTFPKLYLTAAGGLSEQPAEEGKLSYTVRNDVMIYGPGMRMNRNVTRDLSEEDAKSLVFTSQPLPEKLELTGIPIVDLWVTSSHPDGNFIAVLEEVTPDGCSHFICEGTIRASHAKTHLNGVYASMGLPYHRGFREDRVELSPDQPMKLSFHLEATSRVIGAGSRLRLAISCGGSGYQQPEGFPTEPDQMPVIQLYTGKTAASAVTLPVIRPTATVFHGTSGTLYVYKRAVYLEQDGHFHCYPCKQAYPVDGGMFYQTEGFTVTVRQDGTSATAMASGSLDFYGTAKLPSRYTFGDQSGEIPLDCRWGNYPEADVRNLYVATVPVAKGAPGNMNPQLRNTFDLFIDLIYPQGKREKLPCIVQIHGFGGNHHQFENNTELLLEKGFAVASVDYRLCPPNVWPTSLVDTQGCIRYLKAHADELGLDSERFGVIGGSMGGHLASMIAACNGDRAVEGDIGGNTGFDSSVKAGVSAFGVSDFFHFGDDSAVVWPARPDKVANSDGPFAPLGSMLGYVGYGKGMGDIKAHLFDPDPKYRALIAGAVEASPVSHVTEKSAPICLVHGMYECGIQVPMGQSVRLFDAYTRKGVKALLLCNNNGLYGEDPEIKRAIVEFLANRV